MRNQEISRQIQKLQYLIKRTNEVAKGDIELQSHWAKYICVLCSGLLENAIQEFYYVFTQERSNPAVASFVYAQLGKIQNPKTERFIKTSSQFNKTWAKELEIFLSEKERKDAINSVISNRHKIAHGEDSDITITRLKEYLERIIQVLEFIDSQVNN